MGMTLPIRFFISHCTVLVDSIIVATRSLLFGWARYGFEAGHKWEKHRQKPKRKQSSERKAKKVTIHIFKDIHYSSYRSKTDATTLSLSATSPT